MRFSTAPVVACLAGLAASQQYTVVVKNINTLTTKSQALIVPAGQLSISNAPELLLGLGPWPKVVLGFGDIVSTATVVIGSMGGSTYSGSAADEIASAFRGFVEIHEQLLNVLIGKAGFLTQIPFVGPPVTTVLRLIESVVDTFANLLISSVQGAANSVLQAGRGSLDSTVNKAITCYSPDGSRAYEKKALSQ